MVGNVDLDQPGTYKKRKLDDVDQPPSNVIVVTNLSKICRDRYQSLLYNKKEKKKYRVVYDKRVVVLNNYDSVPYGY